MQPGYSNSSQPRSSQFLRLLVVLIIFAGGYFLGQTKPGLIPGFGSSFGRTNINVLNREPTREVSLDMDLFWQVLDLMEKNYLDIGKVKEQDLLYGAINGMVASTGDPYTTFFTPESNTDFKEGLEGLYEGIGAQLGFNKDKDLVVVAPMDSSPAEKAGIKAGDIILEVDGKTTSGWSIPQAVDVIRGKAGTEVKLKLVRITDGKAGDAFELTMKREQIQLPAVRLTWEENNTIAHIRVLRFGSDTNKEWDSVVEQVVKANAKGVVLDVRNNPGGFLDSAIHLGEEFFKDGAVVKRQGTDGVTDFNVDRPCKLCTIPVTVLINEGSASASEILAGAIQARGRGKLVGVKSFGKGTIQEAIELGEGTSLHVTTARWLMPNDKNIHGEGLVPDVEVKTEETAGPFGEGKNDTQLQKAIELLK